MIAVRWYLRYGLSYRDVEELLAERGIAVDHVTVYRWVQRFTPLLIDAARPCRHIPGDRWFVDETYVKVAGRWVYLYRAIDQFGQVIDVLVSAKRDQVATRRFFTRALEHGSRPSEVSTDRAPAYPRVLDELLPSACHVMEQYANNLIESDHGRLKSRLRPMRGLKRLRSARVISADMPSSRTSAEATTNSAWNSTHSIGFRRPSPNSPSQSDRGTTPISRTHSPSTQQCRLRGGAVQFLGVGGAGGLGGGWVGAGVMGDPAESAGVTAVPGLGAGGQLSRRLARLVRHGGFCSQ